MRDGDTVEVRLHRAFEDETAVNSPAIGQPTISGTVQVGETLTADTSGIEDADGLDNAAFTYRWLADNTAIAGATGSTYTLADADEGKAITVQVSFTDDAGNDETLTSAATDAVSAAPASNTPATGAPTVSGTAQVGETLTAGTSGIVDADASRLASFKALRLNMGTSDVAESLLLPADTWARCEGEALPAGPYILGLDLGGSYAQSAASAYWPHTGRLDAFAVFPAMPDLVERGLFDGVGPLYTECARRGELMVMGQRTTDIPALLEAALARWGTPAAVVSDRYRIVELRPHLEAVHFPKTTQLVERGMGYKDGSEDVRAFRRAALDGNVTPVKSLLLRSSMAEARTISDPCACRKLSIASSFKRTRLSAMSRRAILNNPSRDPPIANTSSFSTSKSLNLTDTCFFISANPPCLKVHHRDEGVSRPP